MGKTLLKFFLGLIFTIYCMIGNDAYAQRADNDTLIAQRLETLHLSTPGIDQKVNLSVSGISIQEFLRALAEAAHLNINVDPTLEVQIYNNFQAETARNILIFLAKEYHLDLNVIGSIISVSKLDATKEPKIPKPVKISYNSDVDLLSMELESDSLVSIARTITNLTGKNVLVTNELQSAKATLFVKDLDFSESLRQLAFNNHFKLSETASGTYVFLPLGSNEENYINHDMELGTRRLPAQQNESASSEVFFVDSKKSGDNLLLSIDAENSPLAQIIKSAAEQIDANYFIATDLQGSATTRLRNVTFDDLLTALLKGTEYTHRAEKGIYTIGNRGTEGLRDIKVIQLQHRSIDTVQSMIPSEWKKGVEIKEFREQNTLLLAGSLPQINEIANLILQLDKLVPMILIEVNMLDIRKGHEVETGIRAGISDTIKGGGTLLSGLDFTVGSKAINTFLSRIGTGGSFNLGRVAPNFYVSLSALERNHNVEMRSVPKLSTLNGHPASLSIGNKRYYSVSTQNVLGSLNPQTVVTEQYNEVEANMTIDIVPIVSGDEQVTLKIIVDITDFTKDTPIDQPPPSTTSKFESIIRVRNEETVVLGGIERFESSEGATGVPILSRIPILKWLFSSKSKAKNKVVSVVFIKPTIIYQ